MRHYEGAEPHPPAQPARLEARLADSDDLFAKPVMPRDLAGGGLTC